MTAAIPLPANGPADAFRRAVLWGGAVAGLLDIAWVIVFYAVAFKGVGPVLVLQGVAAGLFGPEQARGGGLAMAALGLAIHFAIAFGVAAVFCAAARRWRPLLAAPWLVGPLYGAAVWLAMNLVVLPLSASPPRAFPGRDWPVILAAHLVCVGPPIVFFARRFLR